MPPLPKKKRSDGRQGKRRSHSRLQAAAISTCPQCQSPKLAHTVCPTCGYYAGRPVLIMSREEKGPEQ